MKQRLAGSFVAVHGMMRLICIPAGVSFLLLIVHQRTDSDVSSILIKKKSLKVPFDELNLVKEEIFPKKNLFRKVYSEIYKNQFLYDKTDLNARIEERDESPEDWIIEKISFNAAYGNERMIAYLFLPKNGTPPFQTIIFFPGANAIRGKDLLISGILSGL